MIAQYGNPSCLDGITRKMVIQIADHHRAAERALLVAAWRVT